MACIGAADKILTGASVESSHVTYWRFCHMKHTAFALEPVESDCTGGTARFGAQNVKFTFQRQGDLVWHTYAKIYLPGIVLGTTSASTGTPFSIATGVDAVYWTNAIGQYLLQQVKLCIGGTIIDTLYDTYMFMWEELSGKPGKRLGEMIGKYDTVLLRQATSRRSRWLYVPLPFYFTENSGLALPLVSLQFHNVMLEISFAQRTNCYVIPSSVTQGSGYAVYVRPDGEDGTDAELNTLTSVPTLLCDTDIKVLIEACYVYLDHDERSKFAHGQFEQIFTEVQQYSMQSSSNLSTATEATAPTKAQVRLQFNHVVMEYIFAVRSQDKVDDNLHFDFGGYFDDDAAGGSGLVLDPVLSVEVTFNNSARVQSRPGSFFRLVQPYQHHTNVPREFIYVWSYAIDPEDAQPTGGANHSRIDNVNINLMLDTRIFKNAQTADVLIYARNKNLLRFKHGLISKKFG
jgi:hypothetical protein